MASSLVETKLYVPRLRDGQVSRPRLRDRLSRGSQSRLTLVSAPAGFGKTTLLTEWLAAAPAEERAVAWLSLDEGDSDSALFWTYLITALQTAVPGVGASALPLLQSARPPIETVLTTVLNELRTLPYELYVVLDDYHLADGPAIQPGMAFLLDHLPPQPADSSSPSPMSRRWRRVPRDGSPPCNWPRCPSRGATTSRGSSRDSPATTATSSTTWSRRS